MISVCFATRNRPEIFKQLWQSVLNTADNPDDIEFSIYRDFDDKSDYEYPQRCKITTGERIYPDAASNVCYKNATGPIYVFTPDDLIFETKGWDSRVKEEFEKSKDKIILVHFNDHHNQPDWGTLPCLHKNWIEVVGYVMPHHLVRRGDVWMHQVGKIINRRVYLKDVYYRDQKITADDTHQSYIKEIERTNNYRSYYSPNNKKRRVIAAQKLQRFIDNYGT